MFPDPRTLSLVELSVAAVVYSFVVLWIQHRLWGIWYRRNLEKNVEAFRDEFVQKINRLENQISEMRRTSRGMV